MEKIYGNHYYRLLAFKESLENEINRLEQTLEAFYQTNMIDHGKIKERRERSGEVQKEES